MPWFKVDDDLAFHAKVVAAGNAAIGMWVRAGAWSAQTLTDGFIPKHMISSLGNASQAKKLVEVGLWSKTDRGFQFHEWDQRQPSRDETERKRAEARDRMKRARQSRKQRNSESNRSQEVRANDERTNGEVREKFTSSSPNPVPTRPNPTRPEVIGNSERGSHVGERASSEPPAATCPKHPEGTTAPCRACGDARTARDRWDADARRRQAEVQSAEARERAELRRAAVEACEHCDDDGRRLDAPGLVCDHTPDQAERTRRGIAAARAKLAAKGVISDA